MKAIPIEINLSPLQVAKKLSHLEGMIFFDSSGDIFSKNSRPLSIITALPEKIFKGFLEENRNILSEIILENQERVSENFSSGALCGWISYEEYFCFGLYRNFLIYDHRQKQWSQIGNLRENFYEEEKSISLSLSKWKAQISESQFLEKVEIIQKYIRQGDIYQANLSQKFEADFQGSSLFPLYEKMHLSTPSPMSCFSNLGKKTLLCSSPETFLKFENRQVESFPIKGTRPRGENPQLDEKLKKDLLTSEKEKAEILMIIDMQRNDLGKTCEKGSIFVPSIASLQTFEHVHHLVGHVKGILSAETDQVSCLSACFPAASITGAPKKRAQEIISEVEKQKRGIYTGIIGYFGFNGMSQFNVVIRSIVAQNKKLFYHVGSGIVADSCPREEYQETLHKAKGLQISCQTFLRTTESDI